MERANFDPHGSKTTEQILMKPRIHNYVMGVTTHANPCGAATTWVVSANVLVPQVTFPFFYSWDRAAPSLIDRFYNNNKQICIAP